MTSHFPRLLLAIAAAIFAFGAAMHALVFRSKASFALDRALLPPFMTAELKVLWLADSTTLLLLALGAAYLSARPSAIRPPAIFLLAALPLATALLLYSFLGPFYAAHMLVAASALVTIAGGLAKFHGDERR